MAPKNSLMMLPSDEASSICLPALWVTMRRFEERYLRFFEDHNIEVIFVNGCFFLKSCINLFVHLPCSLGMYAEFSDILVQSSSVMKHQTTIAATIVAFKRSGIILSAICMEIEACAAEMGN